MADAKKNVKVEETRSYETSESGEAAKPEDEETKPGPDDEGTYQGTEHE